MKQPYILHIKNHQITLNNKPVFAHSFIAFLDEKELSKYKRNYKYSYNSVHNKMKTYKDLNKLFQGYTTGTSICNNQQFSWIRGLSNIINEFNGDYIYINCQW